MLSGVYMHQIATYSTRRYLLILEYFSKYPFLFQMSCTNVNAVTYNLTEPFALKGVPLEVFINIGQPFNPRQLSDISMASNIPLPPYNTLSLNSFIESYIYTLKITLSKATASRIPVPQALMKL